MNRNQSSSGLSKIFNIVLNFVLKAIAEKYRVIIYEKIASIRPYSIVMLGNSLTSQGNWNYYLKRTDIKNSGNGGFTSSHFVWIMDDAVLKYKPRICFIEGGINDIGVGIPLSRTIKNYDSIVDLLIKNKIEPILQSTLHVNQPDDRVTNIKVERLNLILSDLALKKRISFIDLNLYLSENKSLKKEFSKDGIHIKDNAYKIWVNEINKILEIKGI